MLRAISRVEGACLHLKIDDSIFNDIDYVASQLVDAINDIDEDNNEKAQTF